MSAAVPNGVERSEEVASLRAELRALPKVDLHRHLEGSLRLQTLADIGREHGIDLPSYDIEYLRRFATMANEVPDFHRFLEIFTFLRRFYPTRAAVERVAYEAVADAASDNVEYLELRFNPAILGWEEDCSLDEVTTWVCNAVARARSDLGVLTNLILLVRRNEDLNTAFEKTDIALAHRDSGVVGIDLAGDEVAYPAHPFAEVFRRARRQGLHVTVHAGEAGGAGNVREAVELLRAHRIGHGVRVVDSADVVQLAREREVTFEVCPTSNLQTGVVDRVWSHPLADMLELGLRVTINTDDPSIFDATLTDEYLVAVMAMGVTLGQIKNSIVTAVEASFQPPDERRRLVEWFRRELGLV